MRGRKEWYPCVCKKRRDPKGKNGNFFMLSERKKREKEERKEGKKRRKEEKKRRKERKERKRERTRKKDRRKRKIEAIYVETTFR